MAARQHGLLDPILILSRLQRFAQPAPVLVPTELLRSSAVLHARGLMNAQAIQHNMDWVWPQWVVKQFDPKGESFVPRAFSSTHINVTNRNWTAVGLPDFEELPIVDPCGLLTPFLDGWSLDAWLISPDQKPVLPSRMPWVRQRLEWEEDLSVVTETAGEAGWLTTRARVLSQGNQAVCRLEVEATSQQKGWLVIALRPFNPEGVSFIHEIDLLPDRAGWKVGKKERVLFDEPAENHMFSHYRLGDVFQFLPMDDLSTQVRDDVGMATAAALYRLEPEKPRNIGVGVPLGKIKKPTRWAEALPRLAQIDLPDERLKFLYEAAVRSIILHSPGVIYPGPYTYKRFWFRDAAIIIRALACLGLYERAERALDLFPSRQSLSGYFMSQDGEWDSNGQALWAMQQYCLLSGKLVRPSWWSAIAKGAGWIQHHRVAKNKDLPHAGLLPPGFSAEHLGPNDYYYWDDFWAVAGLYAAAEMADSLGEIPSGDVFRNEGDDLLRSIRRSLFHTEQRLGTPAMPATPYRRLDVGAVGSLAAGYPLNLFNAQDVRLLETANFLVKNCLVRGGFFQEISHSGINPYLTLHLAQVLLRAGDERSCGLIQAVADLASPTGQWPEAVHPRTEGGCMGDGQHIWASAEWVLMLRNCFVMEEKDRLILCAGVSPQWLGASHPVGIRQAPTPFGPICVQAEQTSQGTKISWEGAWRKKQPQIEIRLPGHPAVLADPGQTEMLLMNNLSSKSHTDVIQG